MTRTERLERALRRADVRAQRRFHAACEAGVVTDGEADITRLWVQTERLIDAIRVEAAWLRSMAEWTRLQVIEEARVERERNAATWRAFWARHDGPTHHFETTP